MNPNSGGGGGGAGGYNQRAYQPQQPSQQPPQQHQRALASVGSAASLFDSGSNNDDLFNLGSPDQHQQYHQQQQQGYGGGYDNGLGMMSPSQIGTVMEEDEPDSPDLNRRSAGQQQYHHQQQQHHQQQHYAQNDTQQQGYDYGATAEDSFEPPYYPGFIYDPISNSYLPDPNAENTDPSQATEQQPQQQYDSSNEYQQQYDYSNQQYDYGGQYDQHQQQPRHSAQDPNQYDDYAAAAGTTEAHGADEYALNDTFDVPYYPGFIYDHASNSYLPDPNAQAAENESWGGQNEDQQQYSYDQQQAQHENQSSSPVEPGAANQTVATNEETTNWDDYSSSEVGGAQQSAHQQQGYDDPQQQQQQDWSQYEQYDESNVFNGQEQYGTEYNQHGQAAASQDYASPETTSTPIAAAVIEPSKASVPPPPKSIAVPSPAAPAVAAPESEPTNEYDAYTEEQTFGDDSQQQYGADPSWDQMQDNNGDYDTTSWQPQGADEGADGQAQDENSYDPYAQQEQDQGQGQGREEWEQTGYDQMGGYEQQPEQPQEQESSCDPYSPPQQQQYAAPSAPVARQQQQPSPVAAAAPPPQRSTTQVFPPKSSAPPQSRQPPQQQQQSQPTEAEAPHDPYAPQKTAPKKFAPVHAPAPPSLSPTSAHFSTFSPPPRSSSRGSNRSATSSVAAPPSSSSTRSAAPPPPRSNAVAVPPPKSSNAPPKTSRPQQQQPAAIEPPPRPTSAASNASNTSAVAPPPRSDSRGSMRSNASATSALQQAPGSARQAMVTAAPPGRVLSPPPAALASQPPRASAVSPPPLRTRNAASPPPSGRGAQSQRVGGNAQYQSFAAPVDSYEAQEVAQPAPQPQQQRREPPKQQQTQSQPQQSTRGPPQAVTKPPASASASSAPKKTVGGYEAFNPALAASRKAALPAASRMPPPVQPRRLPHQRGASAFAGDSPYATLPEDMPPMPSMNANQGTIGEEAEEEPNVEQAQQGQKEEEIDQSPSWMARQSQGDSYDNSRAWETSSQSSRTSATSGVPAPPPASAQSGAPPPPRAQQQQQQDPSSKPPIRGARKTTPRYAPPPAASNAPSAPAAAPVQQQQQPPPASQAQQQKPGPPQARHPSTAPPARLAQQPPAPRPAGSNAPPTRQQGVPQPPRIQAQQQQQPPQGPPKSTAAPPSRVPPTSTAKPPAPSNSRQQPPPPAPPAIQRRHSRPLSDIREAESPQSTKVPALNFEAPSPEILQQETQEQEDPYAPKEPLYEEGESFDDGRTEREQSVIEHQGYEDENGNYSQQQQQDYSNDDGSQQSSYLPNNDSYDPSASGQGSVRSEYGPDDGQAFEGGMSASTSGSNYGEWTGTSDAQAGYDYVTNGVEGLSITDPYNPSQSAYDYPQAPSRDSNYTPQSSRAASNYGSSPTKSTHQSNPYAPPSNADQYSRAAPPQQANMYAPGQDQSGYGGYVAQQQGAQPFNPYAPPQQQPQSVPSVLSATGSPADLQLDRSTAPVISFGLGGKLVTVFPGGASSAYGGYGAPAGSGPSDVQIRKLADVLTVPDSVAPFPGPMFLDGGKANAGKKRKEGIAWLEARSGEIQKEISYLQAAGPGAFGKDVKGNKRKLETRLILVKLVKVLVENEGKLMGTPKIDEAVRSILAPNTAESADISDADLPTASQLAAAALPVTPTATGGQNTIANYVVTEAHLDKLSSFLLRGERRKAVQYALDHRLWAHAFVISSCVDTDCWKEVVLAFLQSELTPSVEKSTGGANGREAMRVSYAMFAGLNEESIQQFVPPVALAPSMLSPKILPSARPTEFSPNSSLGRRSSNAAENALNRNLPESVLDTWQETCAMIVANRALGDSAALTALGDALAANGWIDAAHVCYLLSPPSSPIGGPGSPGARLALIGSATPNSANTCSVDIESIQLTEMVEFAFSLSPVVKGQEPFVGFPHLQAYRLYHALHIADEGQVAQANRYTDAIIATLKLATKPSPYYTPRLAGEVKAAAERFTAAPGQDKSSWLGRMVPRGPTKEGLWSTLEGGFTKFVAGDGEPTPASLAAKAEVAKAANGAPVGPFSHYSSIAPGSTSGTLQRVASNADFAAPANANPPPRPHSSAAVVAPAIVHQQASPGPPPVKRAPFKTHHSRSSSLGVAGYNYDPNAPPPWQSHLNNRQAQQAPQPEETTPRAMSHEFSRTPQNNYGYAPPSNNNERSDQDDGKGDGLRAPMFSSVDQATFAEDDSGFISPMAAYTPSVSPAPAGARAYNPTPQQHRRTTTQDELEDLGIGNNKSKKPGFDSIGEGEDEDDEEMGVPPSARGGGGPGAASASRPNPNAPTEANGAKKDERPALKNASSRSWLGGWFKRDSPSPVQNGPGPVRANLGEQTSFVYDAELKRWVNRKAGDSGASTPITTVPPPRASTASPSRSSRARYSTETPPPMPPMPSRTDTSSAPPPSLSRSQTTSDLRGNAAAGGRKKPKYLPVT